MEDLKKLTKKKLYQLAKEKNIKGRSKMNKNELIKAIKMMEECDSETSFKAEEKLAEQTKSEEIKRDILIAESYDENSFSSQTHVLKEDSTEAPNIEHKYIKEDYPIPERYNITKIVLLPVDPSKHFTYWELSDETINLLKSQYKDFRFVIKLYDNGDEVLSIDINDPIGKYYIFYHAPFHQLFVVFGVFVNDQFIEIIKSNTIVVPSDEISEFAEEEIWMTKMKDWKEIIKLSHGETEFLADSNLPFQKIIETLIQNQIRKISSSWENLK